jgi:hypothetical protein
VISSSEMFICFRWKEDGPVYWLVSVYFLTHTFHDIYKYGSPQRWDIPEAAPQLDLSAIPRIDASKAQFVELLWLAKYN